MLVNANQVEGSSGSCVLAFGSTTLLTPWSDVNKCFVDHRAELKKCSSTVLKVPHLFERTAETAIIHSHNAVRNDVKELHHIREAHEMYRMYCM
jgi:hypothetical protein